MNEKIKAVWLLALRSPKYQKAVGGLKFRKDGQDMFCALGVLCDLYARTHKDERFWEGAPFSRTGQIAVVSGDCAELPTCVTEWAGLDAYDPTLHYSDQDIKISLLNDGWETTGIPALSFEELADLIEAQL